jgi:hypothetical protein
VGVAHIGHRFDLIHVSNYGRYCTT